jgi:hypothetical protein
MENKRPRGSLYERLEGKPAINAVVDEFATRVAADKRVSGFFARVVRDPAVPEVIPSREGRREKGASRCPFLRALADIIHKN